MPDLQNLVSRMADKRRRMNEIRTELSRLEDEPDRKLKVGEEQRIKDQFRALEKLTSEHDQLRAEWEQQIAAVASDPRNLEHGSDRKVPFDRDPVRDTRDIRRPHNSDPWTITRSGNFGQQAYPTLELRSRALDAIELASGTTETGRANLTRAVEEFDDATGTLARQILLTTAPDYLSAFADMIRGETILSPEEVAAVREVREFQRAYSLTDAAGGFLVPAQLDPAIMIDANLTVNEIRKIARQVIGTSDTWTGVTSTAATASWDAEATEVSDDSTTIAQPSITVHTSRVFLPYSLEIGMDARGNWTSELARIMLAAKDDLEHTAFATGSGSGQPFGIVTALQGGSSEVASGTTDVLAIGDVYNLFDQLPARFQRSPDCAWLAHQNTYSNVRQLAGTNAEDLWATLADPVPEKLLGRRAYASDQIDGTISATQDNRMLVIGDWSNYVIVDRLGFTIEPVPHLFGTNHRPTGQRGLFGYARVGADSVLDRAFRLLNVT